MRRVRLYRVSSLLLRQRDLGEADRIVVLYTRERGKLSAVAKGIRRARSKLAAGLQLFSHSRIQLAAGRTLEVVTQVHPIDTFYHLREEMQRYAHACYVAELLDVLTDEGDPDPPLFETLVATLETLDAGGDPSTLSRAFEINILAHLGYGPELDVCVECGAKVGGRDAGFSAARGGVVCDGCRRATGALAVSSAALRALRDLRRIAPRELAKRRLSAGPREEIERVMRGFVDRQLGRPLRSAEYLGL